MGVFSLEEAVRMITLDVARAWGFDDRGMIRVGLVADLNVFDPAFIAPEIPILEYDLPGGAKRITQRSRGILATVVSGEAVLLNGADTGARPGKLIRGPRR
jgi:N-acyl-D-aspartate/D-glutamate deacylase